MYNFMMEVIKANMSPLDLCLSKNNYYVKKGYSGKQNYFLEINVRVCICIVCKENLFLQQNF